MVKRDLSKDEERLLPREVRLVFELFNKEGYEIYMVGAGVRLMLVGKEPVDCDFTTSATPEEILKVLEGLDTFYDNDYGTVGVAFERKRKEIYEITPYRTERGYTDRRRPDEVKWGKSLEEDVRRRDFTMNSVVVGPKKEGGGYELLDYLGGLKDFENKLVKAVGKAEERFAEDALRMMRAVRFAAQLSFQIEEKTFAGIVKNANLLAEISKERIRDELVKILKSDHPAEGVHLLVNSGLMEYIIPEMLEARGVPQTGHHTLDVYNHMLEALRSCPSPDPIVRLATLLHDIGKPRTRRLRCLGCGWIMKGENLEEKGETAKTTMYKCPRCGKVQTEHEAGTFYGHEVVGARMVETIADRLRFSKKERERLVTLVRWHMFAYSPEMTDAAIRRFIRRVGKENINDIILLRIGDRKGGGSKTTSWRLQELQKRVGEQLYEPMTVSDLVIDGNVVMRILGISPGPKVGEIMNSLFEEVIEDTSKNNQEYLTKRVKEMGGVIADGYSGGGSGRESKD